MIFSVLFTACGDGILGNFDPATMPADFVVVDDNDQYVGDLVAMESNTPDSKAYIYLSSLGLLARVDMETGAYLKAGSGDIEWTGTVCTGTPYLCSGTAGEAASQIDMITVSQTGGTVIYRTLDYTTIPVTTAAADSAGTCPTAGAAYGTGECIEVEANYAAPNFTINAPLRVVSGRSFY